MIFLLKSFKLRRRNLCVKNMGYEVKINYKILKNYIFLKMILFESLI